MMILSPLPTPDSVSVVNSDPGSVGLRDNYTSEQMLAFRQAGIDEILVQLTKQPDIGGLTNSKLTESALWDVNSANIQHQARVTTHNMPTISTLVDFKL